MRKHCMKKNKSSQKEASINVDHTNGKNTKSYIKNNNSKTYEVIYDENKSSSKGTNMQNTPEIKRLTEEKIYKLIFKTHQNPNRKNIDELIGVIGFLVQQLIEEGKLYCNVENEIEVIQKTLDFFKKRIPDCLDKPLKYNDFKFVVKSFRKYILINAENKLREIRRRIAPNFVSLDELSDEQNNDYRSILDKTSLENNDDQSYCYTPNTVEKIHEKQEKEQYQLLGEETINLMDNPNYQEEIFKKYNVKNVSEANIKTCHYLKQIIDESEESIKNELYLLEKCRYQIESEIESEKTSKQDCLNILEQISKDLNNHQYSADYKKADYEKIDNDILTNINNLQNAIKKSIKQDNSKAKNPKAKKATVEQLEDMSKILTMLSVKKVHHDFLIPKLRQFEKRFNKELEAQWKKKFNLQVVQHFSVDAYDLYYQPKSTKIYQLVFGITVTQIRDLMGFKFSKERKNTTKKKTKPRKVKWHKFLNKYLDINILEELQSTEINQVAKQNYLNNQ